MSSAASRSAGCNNSGRGRSSTQIIKDNNLPPTTVPTGSEGALVAELESARQLIELRRLAVAFKAWATRSTELAT